MKILQKTVYIKILHLSILFLCPLLLKAQADQLFYCDITGWYERSSSGEYELFDNFSIENFELSSIVRVSQSTSSFAWLDRPSDRYVIDEIESNDFMQARSEDGHEVVTFTYLDLVLVVDFIEGVNLGQRQTFSCQPFNR